MPWEGELAKGISKQSRDPRVDAQIEGAPEFARPILCHLRMLIHQAGGEVEETIKWQRPFFLHQGQIVCSMGAFKAHCSLGIWGEGMSEVLRAGGVSGDDASGSIGRITSLTDLPDDALLLEWLRQAFQIASAKASEPRGVRSKSAPQKALKPLPKIAKGELAIPEDLVRELARIKGATENFDAFAPSCRKEYVEWIEEAKRPETRARRLGEAAAWIAQGKRRNWKYEAS